MTEIITVLFKITEHALGIYETKQARKYLDRVIKLREMYYNESNKHEDKRNHALLDNIEHELRIIVEAVTEFGKPNPQN